MKPAEWTTCRLGEIAEIVMGQSPSGETCNNNGIGVPLLNGPTEFGSHSPSPVQFTFDPKKKSKKNDILFCVRGSTTGRMNWSDQEFAIGRGLAAIRSRTRTDLQYFIKGIIDYNLNQILGASTGSTFPNVSRDQLNNLEIIIPTSKDEQSRIASILSSLDDKIELNFQMNKTLEAIAQAIFKEWFIDFRFPGFDGELVDGLPKGWRRGKVADLLTISKNTISPSDYPQKEFYHYSIPAFDEGKSPVKERGKTILSNKFIVRNNSILISKLNPRFPRIWPIRDIDEERCICSTEFLVLQPKTINNYSFIISFLNLKSTMSSMAGLVTGTSSSHQRIRPLDLMSLQLILPNINVLDEYERTVCVIVERYIRNINENQTLTQLRDKILPKLMTGKIRVA